jgi:hypothetical protein
MRIGFIHFHLKPGGVTSVIKQQVAQCKHLGFQPLVLCGENPIGLPDALILEDLQYQVDQPHSYRTPDPNDLARSILSAFKKGFGGKDVEMIHIHNPLLKKNTHLLPALALLANQGIPLLFHIHDPSEDGRPDMVHHSAYPANVHYCFLNSRDRDYFIAAGIPQQYAHVLPNQVSDLPPATSPLSPSDLFDSNIHSYLTYPVRAIPRKNCLEPVLLSQLVKGVGIAVTLPPNNPQDLPEYNRMVEFTRDLGAPVIFEAGLNHNFAQLLAGSSGTITTSVKEGFGFTFLEPWTIDKPVFGRFLPGICGDFEAQGVNLNGLYQSLLIPTSLDLFDVDLFKDHWISTWDQELRTMLSVLDPLTLGSKGLDWLRDSETRLSYVKEQCAGLFTLEGGAEAIDFSFLNVQSKIDVLMRISHQNNPLIFRLNPHLEMLKERVTSPDTLTQIVRENKRIVQQQYGFDPSCEQLASLYERVLSTPPKTYSIDRQVLISKYLFPLSQPAWGKIAEEE